MCKQMELGLSCKPLQFFNYIVFELSVRCISPILFVVGIQNLMCRYTLGFWSVAYYFGVNLTLTLTSDLNF